MSRSRMFGDDPPDTTEMPSPRTTIVGGRPPESDAALPPIPTGMQQLVRLASVDSAFRAVLVEKRSGVAEAAGVTLTGSERAILDAVPASQLQAMAGTLPPPSGDRRSFLRRAAASAVLLLGGASLGGSVGCRESGLARPSTSMMARKGGAAPDPPPEPLRPERAEPTKGILPDLPPPRDVEAPEDTGDVPPERPERPRPTRGSRPDRPNATRGIRPDRPSPPPAGARPDLPSPKPAGARPDLPPPRPDHDPDPFPGS